MNLLIVANLHTPLHSPHTGGMERSTFELILSLAATARDRSISVLAHPGTVLPEGVRLIPADFHPCPDEYLVQGDGQRKWYTYSSEAVVLSQFSSKPSFDIVHDCSTAIAATILAKRFRIPTVQTMRLMPWHPGYVFTVPYVDHRIYISHFQKSRDRWGGQNRSTVIRDAIPVHARNLGNRTHTTPFAISVGRIERRKGHHIAAIISSQMNLPIRIFGKVLDTDYFEALRSTPGVELVTERPWPDVLAEMSGAEFLIWTPTIDEPNGRVVIEALRLGTPVIGSITGALAEIQTIGESTIRCFAKVRQPMLEVAKLPPCWTASSRELADQYWRVYDREIQ